MVSSDMKTGVRSNTRRPLLYCGAPRIVYSSPMTRPKLIIKRSVKTSPLWISRTTSMPQAKSMGLAFIQSRLERQVVEEPIRPDQPQCAPARTIPYRNRALPSVATERDQGLAGSNQRPRHDAVKNTAAAVPQSTRQKLRIVRDDTNDIARPWPGGDHLPR